MEKSEIKARIDRAISALSQPDSYNLVYHKPIDGMPMPSVADLERIVNLCRDIIFPGYFSNNVLSDDTLLYYTGVNTDTLFRLLKDQLLKGQYFACSAEEAALCSDCELEAERTASLFIEQLPDIRHKLSTDIQATYDGDPAAKSIGEIIFCYPVIKALLNYRIAHAMHKLDVPIIPRIITELAHSETGIDIHPAAQIDEYFTIDHGTGVVIGATCIIGKHVQLYQGVTLGAKSFPLDAQGNPIKGIPRHPIVEDNVVIYSNATILGRITVGRDSMIGGNVWITRDVPAGSKMMQSAPRQTVFMDGAGI